MGVPRSQRGRAGRAKGGPPCRLGRASGDRVSTEALGSPLRRSAPCHSQQSVPWIHPRADGRGTNQKLGRHGVIVTLSSQQQTSSAEVGFGSGNWAGLFVILQAFISNILGPEPRRLYHHRWMTGMFARHGTSERVDLDFCWSCSGSARTLGRGPRARQKLDLRDTLRMNSMNSLPSVCFMKSSLSYSDSGYLKANLDS